MSDKLEARAVIEQLQWNCWYFMVHSLFAKLKAKCLKKLKETLSMTDDDDWG